MILLGRYFKYSIPTIQIREYVASYFLCHKFIDIQNILISQKLRPTQPTYNHCVASFFAFTI